MSDHITVGNKVIRLTSFGNFEIVEIVETPFDSLSMIRFHLGSLLLVDNKSLIELSEENLDSLTRDFNNRFNLNRIAFENSFNLNSSAVSK
jgi:hypothetical protein